MAMAERTANVVWEGDLAHGAGFQAAAEGAKAGCPVSNALTGVHITLTPAVLEN